MHAITKPPSTPAQVMGHRKEMRQGMVVDHIAARWEACRGLTYVLYPMDLGLIHSRLT